MNRRRLQITCPDGNPNDAKILLDGEELPGVCSIKFEINPDNVVVTLVQLLLGELEVDVGLIERVLEGKSKPVPVVKRWLLWIERAVVDRDFGLNDIMDQVRRVQGRIVWVGTAEPAMCIEVSGHLAPERFMEWRGVYSVEPQPLPLAIE